MDHRVGIEFWFKMCRLQKLDPDIRLASCPTCRPNVFNLLIASPYCQGLSWAGPALARVSMQRQDCIGVGRVVTWSSPTQISTENVASVTRWIPKDVQWCAPCPITIQTNMTVQEVRCFCRENNCLKIVLSALKLFLSILHTLMKEGIEWKCNL